MYVVNNATFDLNFIARLPLENFMWNLRFIFYGSVNRKRREVMCYMGELTVSKARGPRN